MAARNASRSGSGGGVPVGQGIMVGAAVWVVSFVLVLLAGTILGGGGVSGQGLLFGGLFGMLYVNLGGIVMFGQFVSLSGSLLVLLLIPLFGAVFGGFVVGSASRGGGLMAGASVAIGFFIFQIIGLVAGMLLLSSMTGGLVSFFDIGGTTIAILVLGGLVQPAIFGAIGGALGGS